MKRSTSFFCMACLVILLLTPSPVAAEPDVRGGEPARLAKILSLSPVPPAFPARDFLPVLQSDDWGGGEGEGDDDGWDAWGGDDDLGFGEETPEAGTGSKASPSGGGWIGMHRIGLDVGGFIPLAEKREAYSPAEMAGIFFGYNLTDAGPVITGEVRLLQAYTRSNNQDEGFNVSTFLFMGRHDVLLHLLPGTWGFSLYGFLGLGLVLEASSSKSDSPTEGGDPGTYVGVLVDGGVGAWLNLGGSVDLLFRMELNLVPVTENVPVFLAGQAGLQYRF
jgi:hypothetical protein